MEFSFRGSVDLFTVLPFRFISGHRLSTVTPYRPPSLGILVAAIKECSEKLGQAVEMHKQTSEKLQNVGELTGEELREVREVEMKSPVNLEHLLSNKPVTSCVDCQKM